MPCAAFWTATSFSRGSSAAQGHYPAIDILHSVSRLTSAIATPAQKEAARKIRDALSAYRDAEDLIQLGAYVAGSNPAARRQHPPAPGVARLPAPGPPAELAAAGDPVAVWRHWPPVWTCSPAQAQPRLSDEVRFHFPLREGPRLAPHPARTRRGPLQAAGGRPGRARPRSAPNWKPPAIRAEIEVREWRPVAGGDLARPRQLPPARQGAGIRDRAPPRRGRAKAGRTAEASMLEARRRCRLLERLKERRLAGVERRSAIASSKRSRRNATWRGGTPPPHALPIMDA